MTAATIPAHADLSGPLLRMLGRVEHVPTFDAMRAFTEARTPDTPDDPVQQAVLLRALARLPDKQRRAVVYHHIAGLPFADIAGLLGNSPDAARRAAADGLKTLRRIYPKAETP